MSQKAVKKAAPAKNKPAKGAAEAVKTKGKVAEAQAAAPAESNEDEGDEDMGGNGAQAGMSDEGLAAVTGAAGAAEATGGMKNFRHHPDMENFYRFIYENDLRYEALAIIDEIMSETDVRKRLKAEKAKAIQIN